MCEPSHTTIHTPATPRGSRVPACALSQTEVAIIDPDDELAFISRVKALRECLMLQLWMAPDNVRESIFNSCNNTGISSFLDNLDQLIAFHELVLQKNCKSAESWNAFASLFIFYAQFKYNLQFVQYWMSQLDLVEIECFFQESQWDFVCNRLKLYVEKAEAKQVPAVLLKSLKNVSKDVTMRIEMYKEFAEVLELESRISTKFGGKMCPPLIQGGRRLIKHSELWKIDKSGKKSLHYFILFNDILMFLEVEKVSKNSTKDPRLYFKKTFSLDACHVENKHRALKFDFDFVFRNSEMSFVVCFKNQDERDSWFSSLQNAIKLASRSSSLTIKAPVWVPPHMCKKCFVCKTKFGIMSRKHHCRFW
jgi:hypothetical protein